MIDPANEIRGEIDLELEGQRFVLRPSYGAIVSAEKQTGLPLLHLAQLADTGSLSMDQAAIVTAEMMRAWGLATPVTDHTPAAERGAITAAAACSKESIGELIYTYGLVKVMPRLAIALARAASGGCRPDGSQGEAMTTETTAIPVVDLQE